MSTNVTTNGLRFLSRPLPDIPEIDRVDGVPHPREMLDLIGHEQAEAEFLTLYTSGKMHHAFLLIGQEGVGKATFAYRAARFLLHNKGENGGLFGAQDNLYVPENAQAAHLVAHESHPDLAILRRGYDADTKKYRQVISVEDTRDVISLFEKTAAFGGWRIIIVDSADELNANSANALLKTLEDPPQRSLFFLVAHQPQNLLPTIRSRCRTLVFHPLEDQELKYIIASLKPDSDQAIVDEAVKRAGGSVRKALRLLEPSLIAYFEQIEAALNGLPKTKTETILRITDSLKNSHEGRQPFVDLLDAVEHWLAHHMRLRVDQGGTPHALAELWAKMRSRADVVEEYNLDRRAFAITLFEELSTLV